MDKSIIIQLVDGISNGTKFIKLGDFSSLRAILIPRAAYKEKSILFENIRKYSCIYFLINCNSESKIYIGQTNSIIDRINLHFKNKDWWSDYLVVFYTSDNSFTKSDLEFLEQSIVSKISLSSIFTIENIVKPLEKNIDEFKKTPLLKIEEDIAIILATLGYRIFDEIKKDLNSTEFVTTEGRKINKIDVVCKNANGYFFPDNNSLLVLKGSVIKKKTAEHFKNMKNFETRRNLINKAVLLPYDENSYIFTTNFSFDSPSEAASIVLGGSSNGLKEWTLFNSKKTLGEEISA